MILKSKSLLLMLTTVSPTVLSTVDKENVTISGSNLTATGTALGGVRSQHMILEGKYYWEVLASTINSASSGAGIASANGFFTTPTSVDFRIPAGRMTASAEAACICFKGTAGGWYNNGTNTAKTIGTYVAGDRYCFALDMDNKRFSVRLNNGNWNGNAANTPSTAYEDISAVAALGVYAVIVLGAVSEVMTANFGASAFTYAVPTGFTPGFPQNGGAYIDAGCVIQAQTLSSAATVAATIRGAKAGTKIVAVVGWEKTTTCPALTGVSGNTLGAFTLQNTLHIKPSTIDIRIETYVATVGASDITGETITATLASTGDKASILIFGLGNPQGQDSNGSLPATNSAAATATPTVTGISTTNAKDLLIEYFVHTNNADMNTAAKVGSGQSLLAGVFNHTLGVNWCNLYAYGKYVNTTQSGIAITAGASLGTNGEWAAMVEGYKIL